MRTPGSSRAAGSRPRTRSRALRWSDVTLTKCEFKPGTCEGSLVLDSGGTPVTIKVPQGTAIKKGNDHLFLPGIKGQVVTVSYNEDKGEKIARSIDVKGVK